MPRVLRGSQGGGRFLMGAVSLYVKSSTEGLANAPAGLILNLESYTIQPTPETPQPTPYPLHPPALPPNRTALDKCTDSLGIQPRVG